MTKLGTERWKSKVSQLGTLWEGINLGSLVPEPAVPSTTHYGVFAWLWTRKRKECIRIMHLHWLRTSHDAWHAGDSYMFIVICWLNEWNFARQRKLGQARATDSSSRRVECPSMPQPDAQSGPRLSFCFVYVQIAKGRASSALNKPEKQPSSAVFRSSQQTKAAAPGGS